MATKRAGRSRTQQLSVVIALLFGLATLGAGGGVLAGRDPGYVVYQPLLMFNTLMGVGYMAAGFLAWRHVRSGRNASALIFALNLLVLGGVSYRYRTGSDVAIDSVRAMIFRTVVWLALASVLAWASREAAGSGDRRR